MTTTNTATIQTITLRGGLVVFARPMKGSGNLFAVTYANQTQAEKMASKLGSGWRVAGPFGFGRARFVAQESS